jgi:hypothetical protein
LGKRWGNNLLLLWLLDRGGDKKPPHLYLVRCCPHIFFPKGSMTLVDLLINLGGSPTFTQLLFCLDFIWNVQCHVVNEFGTKLAIINYIYSSLLNSVARDSHHFSFLILFISVLFIAMSG